MVRPSFRFAALSLVAAILAACTPGPEVQPAAIRYFQQPQPVIQTASLVPVAADQRPFPHPRPKALAPLRTLSPAYRTTGVASWYGPGFHGRRTASGEVFDMNAMTAAHRTLPFGTQVLVTNLANNTSLNLIINDRGPFVGKRIIDVSREAAEQLGFLDDGLTQVRVVALE